MARRQFQDISEISEQGAAIIQHSLNRNAQVLQFQAAGSETYQGTLMGISGVIHAAAEEEVHRQVMQAGGRQNFSAINIQAMTAVEAFRQVSGLDLTAVLLRAHYLRTIQEQNLLVNHPAQFGSLSEMASQNGCSVTDMLATLDMVNIVFPFVQNDLDIPVYEFWATLGKSKIKEMLPVLKSLITGQQSDTASTRAAVERLIDEQYAGFRMDDQYDDLMAVIDSHSEYVSDEERQAVNDQLMPIARRNIIEHLIEMGGNLPIQEMRRHLRPERTNPVPFYIVPDGTGFLLTSSVDADQMQMLRNKMGERGEFQDLNLSNDPRTRQAEAFNNPLLRRLYTGLFGGQR